MTALRFGSEGKEGGGGGNFLINRHQKEERGRKAADKTPNFRFFPTPHNPHIPGRGEEKLFPPPLFLRSFSTDENATLRKPISHLPRRINVHMGLIKLGLLDVS